MTRAPCMQKAEFVGAQQAFYLGSVRVHGIKVKTVFLPNGLVTLFGPILAQGADKGMLVKSNLYSFHGSK